MILQNARNANLWNSKPPYSCCIIFSSTDVLATWVNAQNAHSIQTVRVSTIIRWLLSVPRRLKCNVYGRAFCHSRQVSYGVVLRNSIDSFLAGVSGYTIDSDMSIIAEVYTLGESLVWLINDTEIDSKDNIDTEIDSKRIVDAVYSAHEDFSEFGQLVANCKFLL